MQRIVNKEPIYDDDMLTIIKEQETAELIKALLCYTRTLRIWLWGYVSR
jgi:hypothetical protein